MPAACLAFARERDRTLLEPAANIFDWIFGIGIVGFAISAFIDVVIHVGGVGFDNAHDAKLVTWSDSVLNRRVELVRLSTTRSHLLDVRHDRTRKLGNQTQGRVRRYFGPDKRHGHDRSAIHRDDLGASGPAFAECVCEGFIADAR